MYHFAIKIAFLTQNLMFNNVSMWSEAKWWEAADGKDQRIPLHITTDTGYKEHLPAFFA